MKKTTSKSGSKAVKVAVIGASLAALAGSAYFLFGPKGKKHQKQAKAWAIKMKGDVVEKLESAREVSEPIYREIIDSVATEYEKSKRAGKEEIVAMASDLKKHWKTLSKDAKAAKRDTVASAGRVAEKAGL